MLNSTSIAAIILLSGTVFSAFGWLITHTVLSLISAPILEYEVDTKDSGSICSFQKNLNTVTVNLLNLSRATKFENMHFVLRLDINDSSIFKSAEIIF